MPGLLLVGVPPLTALGTNRLQAVIGELASFLTYVYYREIRSEQVFFGILSTTIGAILGSYAVSLFTAGFLRLLLPFLMLSIALYSIFSNRLKNVVVQKPKITPLLFMVMMGLMIGFYNGFLGPGTGAIWMIAFVILMGYTIKQASISTKPLNLVGNMISLIFFIIIGNVNYYIAVSMGLGQIFGSVIGSKIVVRNGDKVVRPVFILVTIFLTLKLLSEQFGY